MDESNEPAPPWSNAPRLCPQRAFPPYRYVPGVNPHPRQSPQGHSYGKADEVPPYLPPERWRENETYLYGIDLYHAGYLWESHEAWEALWHLTDKKGPEGQCPEAQFLQGLIQNSAALLKVQLKNWSAAKHLSQEAHRRLKMVVATCDGEGCFMGLHLADFIQAMETFYQPVWEGKNFMHGNPPKISILTSKGIS